VALLSPCPAYQSSGVLAEQLRSSTLVREATLEQFGAWASPFAPLCGGRGKEGLCGPPIATGAVRVYRAKAAAAAAALRSLREQSNHSSPVKSLGILVGAPVSHFPEIAEVWPETSNTSAAVSMRLSLPIAAQLDGPGSYDRYLASSLLWLHTRLRSAPNATTALAYLATLGIRGPAPVAIFSKAKTAGYFEPSVGLGASRAEQSRGCAQQADVAACMLPFTLSVSGSHGAIGAVRPATCAPERAVTGVRWRQRVERDVARAAGIA